MIFDLQNSAIYQAVKWERQPLFRLAKIIKRFFSILFAVFFLLFLYGFLNDSFSQPSLSFLFGFSLISLTLFASLWLKQAFFNSKLKKPKLGVTLAQVLAEPDRYNLAEFLSFEAARAVWQSVNFSKKKKLARVSSEALLYFSLTDWSEANFVFSRALLDLKEIKGELKIFLDSLKPEQFQEVFSPDFLKVILEAAKISQEKGRETIGLGDILFGQCQIDPVFKKHMVRGKLNPRDIESLTFWLSSAKERIAERKKFWLWKNLIKRGSLAKAWASGYTINLDRFGLDFSELVKKQGFPEQIGHQKEIKLIERILARRKINNCLLIGEPGVGRKSMIMALAQRTVMGESLAGVNYKRVIQLDLASLSSQTKTPAEAEALLDMIFREAVEAGNVILVIDKFHNYISGKEKLGMIDISGVISSYLDLPQFQIVALTTYSGLHRHIEENPSILSLFEKVEVPEISEKETLMILENLLPFLERKYKRFVSFPALREIVSLSKKYLPAVPFPKSAMDLLDEAMVYISSTKDKVLLPKDIARIISEKTEIPVGEMEVKEKEILLNLENLVHQRIINQEEAVREISTALRRARAEVTKRSGPMGTFLFLGPTGVGKTETSKALAQIYFTSESRMIRLDMSEFQNLADISRLLGAAGQEGLLTTRVRENSFSLVLLDEIEKAHKNILNLFLQVLDEGHLTDGLGRKVNFENSIIIATSNAGYQIILKALKEKTEWSQVKQKLLDYIFEKAIFRPEFINRFDAVVIFSPLNKENLLAIAELMLQRLKKNLKEKNIEFVISQKLKEKIVELSYDPTFGARQMKRVIQDKVENVLASALLSGRIKRGDKVEVEPENFELKVGG